jgi:hypothetical protein
MNNTFLKNNDILKFVERMNQTRLSKKKKTVCSYSIY